MISKKHLDYRITELEAKMMLLEDKLMAKRKGVRKDAKKISK